MWFLFAKSFVWFCTLGVGLLMELNGVEGSGQNKSVIIVGGGVSGLVAAATLLKAKAGFTVTLLEAGDRMGGRVNSQKIGDHLVEFGAQWVHGEKGNSVYELMAPYGVLEGGGQEDTNDTSQDENLDNIYVTQKGEEMDSIFIDRMNVLFKAIHDEDEDFEKEEYSIILNSTKALLLYQNPLNNKSTSLGHFTTALFKAFNDKYPLHKRETVRTAALDWLHRGLCVENGCDDWFMLSNSDAGEQFEYCEGNAEVTWKSPASYSTLLKVILGQPINGTEPPTPPEWVKFSQEVTEIRYDTDNNSTMVKLTCKDGSVYEADHVITTVSLGVLKDKHSSLFSPKLSAKKQLAIDNIGFGTVNKIYLEFETDWWSAVDENFTGFNPLWENVPSTQGHKQNLNNSFGGNYFENELLEVFDELPLWTRSIESFILVPSHPKVLQGWIPGVSARFMENLPIDHVTNSSMTLIRKFLSGRFPSIPDPIRTERSRWFNNSLFKGSYSYRTVQSEETNVWAKDLAEPILNGQGKPIITFAGEATHDNYFSTVHGAYDSGVREATRIIVFHENIQN